MISINKISFTTLFVSIILTNLYSASVGITPDQAEINSSEKVVAKQIKVYTVRLQDANKFFSSKDNLYKIEDLKKNAIKTKTYKERNSGEFYSNKYFSIILKKGYGDVETYNKILAYLEQYSKTIKGIDSNKISKIINTFLRIK